MKKYCLFILFLFSTIAAAKLQHDPQQLRQFQNTGKCEACDLSSTHITVKAGVQAPFDLWYANLSEAIIAIKNNSESHYYGVNATYAHFSHQDYSRSDFTNATLAYADFTGANLTETNFAGANVTGANFSNANLSGSQGINIEEAYSVCNAILPDGVSRGRC